MREPRPRSRIVRPRDDKTLGERRWEEIVLKTNEKGKREGAFLKTKA